jgi:hypothetical protein
MEQSAASTAVWPHAAAHDLGMSASGDDFASFLDLGDFAEFPSVETIPCPSHGDLLNQDMDGVALPPSTMNETNACFMPDLQQQQQQQQKQQQAASIALQQQHSLQSIAPIQASIEAPVALDLQTQLLQQQRQQQRQQLQHGVQQLRMQEQVYQRQQRQQQQQQQQQWMLPPTPNSGQIHGAVRYYPQLDTQTQAICYQRPNEDQVCCASPPLPLYPATVFTSESLLPIIWPAPD